MRRRSKPTLDSGLARQLLNEVAQPAPFPGVTPPPPKTVFDLRKCFYCQGLHSRKCPAVAHVEYHESGTPKSVTYFPHGQWPEDQVIWLEDVMEAAAESTEDE